MENEQPVEAEVAEPLRAIARALDEFINPDPKNKRWGFAVLMFRFGMGDDHRSNYISNAEREDMLAAMKEFVARAEGRYHEPGDESERAPA